MVLFVFILQFPNQSISPTPGWRSPTASGGSPTDFFTVPGATVEYVESRFYCSRKKGGHLCDGCQDTPVRYLPIGTIVTVQSLAWYADMGAPYPHLSVRAVKSPRISANFFVTSVCLFSVFFYLISLF